jgi:DNA-binding CsgD family transcriptional regulator
MEKRIYSVITGTGSYIPSRVVKNEDFIANEFYESNAVKIDKSGQEIADKLYLSRRTVESQREALISKTGTKNSASLVRFAMRNGYVT